MTTKIGSPQAEGGVLSCSGKIYIKMILCQSGMRKISCVVILQATGLPPTSSITGKKHECI